MRINHRKPILCRSFFAIACGIVFTAFAACGGDESSALDEDLLHVGDPVVVSIVASGIESFAELQESGTRAEGGARLTTDEQIVCSQAQPMADGSVAVATVKASKPASAAGGATSPSTRAITLTNTTLRVVVYDYGRYVDDCLFDVDGNGVATAQSGQQLVVPFKGDSYRFYCYSPGTRIYNRNTWRVAMEETDKVAYGSTEVLINSTTGAQTVAFPTLKLGYTRMKLVVTDYDKRPVTCTGTIVGDGFADPATFDMRNGHFSRDYDTPLITKTFSGNNTEIAFPSWTYMTLDDPNLDLANVKIGNVPVTIPAMNLPNFEADAGTKYTIFVEIHQPQAAPWVEVPSAGLKVARGNLFRANGTGLWFLAPDQSYFTYNYRGGDYFCWGIDDSFRIGTYDGVNMAGLDAGCVAVMGPGWRVPGAADLQKLINSGKVRGDYYNYRNEWVPGWYFGTTVHPPSSLCDKYVFLPFNGRRKHDGGMEAWLSHGHYWTRDAYSATESRHLVIGDNVDLSYMAQDQSFAIRCVANL